MDIQEAAALLAVCAGFDNRKPDADTARVWAAALDDIHFEDARQAVVMHYRNEHRWIMPADVIKGVKEIERDRIAAAPNIDMLTPPDEVTRLDGDEFDVAYLRWQKDTIRRIRRGLPIEAGDPHVPVESGRQRIRELVDAVAQEHRAS